MPVKVVDASIVAAIVFGEPDAERAAKLIDNADLVAPHLLRFEVTNIAWKKIRRRVKQADLIAAGLRLALELDVDYVEVDHEAVLDPCAPADHSARFLPPRARRQCRAAKHDGRSRACRIPPLGGLPFGHAHDRRQ